MLEKTNTMNEAEVVEILLAIEKIVQGSEFSAWQRNFIDAHVDKFDFGEENKVCTSPSVSSAASMMRFRAQVLLTRTPAAAGVHANIFGIRGGRRGAHQGVSA